MVTPPTAELDPAHLPPGTPVGLWRVVSRSAQGTYGTVYRAVSLEQDEPVYVALKVARYPEDPRFGREAAVLSQLDHPSVPLLLDHGRWRLASGVRYPYLTMAWVEGTPLYDWAREHNPTSRQVLRLLAHLARALQATHAAGAVHRDVKGDNVLVRHQDSRALLMDFGSTNFRGAARLTWQTLPPGTPAYRSPEAWRFLERFGLASDAHYVAKPADDVFALGVTAYRLVTGQYPPSTEPGQEEARVWEPGGSGPKPPLELNPRVDQWLSELILNMLSIAPEARATAKTLANAMEPGADEAVPELDQQLFSPEPPPQPVAVPAETAPPPARTPTGGKAPTGPSRPWARNLDWLPWLVLAAAGILLAIRICSSLSTRIDGSTSGPQATSDAYSPDANTVGVGDTAHAAAERSNEAPSDKEPVASDTPEQTFPRQAQPDAKGRCPRPEHVVLNGLCWAQQSMGAEACEGGGYVYSQGKCYTPVFKTQTRRRPTSSPSDSR